MVQTTLENGNYWMSLLKQDSIEDILNDQVNMVMNEVEVDPSPIWLVEDEEVQVFLTVNHTKKLMFLTNKKWKINLPIFTSHGKIYFHSQDR